MIFYVNLQFIEDFHPFDTSTVRSQPLIGSTVDQFSYWPNSLDLPRIWSYFICSVVSIVSSTKLLAIPQHPDINLRLMDINKRIQKMAEKAKSIKNITIGNICLARWPQDKKWYRAKISSHDSKARTVVVTYLDYMNSETLSVSEIRVCPHEIYSWPTSTICIRLYGIAPHPKHREEDVMLALYNVVVSHNCYARIVKSCPPSGDKSVPVELFASADMAARNHTLYKELIDQGYYVKKNQMNDGKKGRAKKL